MKLILDLIKKIISATDGWKAVIGYILLQIPFFAANPMLVAAVEKVAANPQDAAAWGDLVANLLLAIGILHRIFKNVKGL